MSGSYLLDTNLAIALLENEPAVVNRLRQADRVFLSSVVVGELHYGARKSGRPAENLARVEALSQHLIVLSCDVETAHYYGEIKNRLREKGRPIPENDIWIAATTMQHGLALATRDAHFVEVSGLTTQMW